MRFPGRLRDMRAAVLLALVAVSVAATADRFDRDIPAAMRREHVPGLSFAVVRNGQLVRSGGYGLANLEWGARVTPDTKFEIASMSKMFVGAAARILIEDGKLNPDEAVSRYFPTAPQSWSGMKVRHLLTMSSGLPEDFGVENIPYNQDVIGPADDATMWRAFFDLRLQAPIGRRFVYSGTNYALLGHIVATASNTSYQEFVRERILAHAGMRDSSFIDNTAVVARRASGYRRTGSGDLKNGWYLGQYLHSRPDVGILTTAPDLAKWLVALEQRKIVRAPEALWEQTVSDTGSPLDYSYGWMTDTWLGHRRQSHAGGYRTGFHTFIARYPDDGIGIVVLTNCDFSAVRDYVNTIAEVFIPGVPDPATQAQKADENPEETQTLIRAMQSLRDGRIDETSTYADAVEPEGIDEIR